MQLEACTTWECANSFSDWIAAFGTILVSAIALWLSVKDRMVNMRAQFDSALVPGAMPTVLDREGFMLSYTNIGPRPITVVGHDWSFPFARHRLFFMPQMDREIAHLCTSIPVEITDGKSGHIFYKLRFFSELDQPEAALFHPNSVVAFARIRLFRIHISTSVGKRIPVRVSRTARRRLWSLYRTRFKVIDAGASL